MIPATVWPLLKVLAHGVLGYGVEAVVAIGKNEDYGVAALDPRRPFVSALVLVARVGLVRLVERRRVDESHVDRLAIDVRERWRPPPPRPRRARRRTARVRPTSTCKRTRGGSGMALWPNRLEEGGNLTGNDEIHRL